MSLVAVSIDELQLPANLGDERMDVNENCAPVARVLSVPAQDQLHRPCPKYQIDDSLKTYHEFWEADGNAVLA